MQVGEGRLPPSLGSGGGMIDILQPQLRSELESFDYKRLLVAFSGGLDSTVLLQIAKRLVPSVTALHINHGLHAEAGSWQRHCALVCDRLGVEFLSRRVQVAGGNLEAAARHARYRAFDALLGAGDLLLLAHHQEDQAETVLMRLVQGRGALAMPCTRRLDGGALILRPLLTAPKSWLLDAANELGVDWIEDPGNEAAQFDRNYLRREILPRLRQRWPGVAEALATTARQGQVQSALLSHLLDAETLDLGAFSKPLQVPALRAWLARFDEYRPSNKALAGFAAQCSVRLDAQPELRLSAGFLRRFRGAVHYVRLRAEPDPCYSLHPPCSLTLPHGQLIVEPAATAGFYAQGALKVGFRRGGERIDCNGHHRPLKAIFRMAGVPPWERDAYPLIYRGDELCAVPGIAVAEQPLGKPRWRARWGRGQPATLRPSAVKPKRLGVPFAKPAKLEGT